MTTTARTSIRPREATSPAEGRPGQDSSDKARRVNERFRARRQPHEDSLFVALCECGRRGCRSAIELRVGEYYAIRRNTDWYIVIDGHEDSRHRTVHSTARYLLVSVQGRWAGSKRLGSRQSA